MPPSDDNLMNHENITEAERKVLNLEWLPLLTIQNVDKYFEGARTRSATARGRLDCCLDISYGDSPRQVQDVFPATAPRAPVFVFIHGGYWRAFEKDLFSEVVEPVIQSGGAAVALEYEICPHVTIPDIVGQVRRSLIWTFNNIDTHNGDPQRIHVCGHSAGGQLAGMMMATDWQTDHGLPADLLKGAILISGIFDIEPHRHTDLQDVIGLTPEIVAANSPQHLPLHFNGPVICALGGRESASFKRQSKEFTQKCHDLGLEAQYLEMGSDNHLDVTNRLAEPDHPLTRAILAQMELS